MIKKFDQFINESKQEWWAKHKKEFADKVNTAEWDVIQDYVDGLSKNDDYTESPEWDAICQLPDRKKVIAKMYSLAKSERDLEEFMNVNENANIIANKYNITTINDPIVPDAITVMSNIPEAVNFTDREKFDAFLIKQTYFSCSYSHCYYTKEDLQKSHKDGTYKNPAENCVMLFETGHELVAVWNDKNSIGYILPSKYSEANNK